MNAVGIDVSISCVTRTHRNPVVQPAQIECCERERRLTDSLSGVLAHGYDCQATPPHSNSFSFEMEKDAAGCRALNRNYYCRRFQRYTVLAHKGITSQWPAEYLFRL